MLAVALQRASARIHHGRIYPRRHLWFSQLHGLVCPCQHGTTDGAPFTLLGNALFPFLFLALCAPCCGFGKACSCHRSTPQEHASPTSTQCPYSMGYSRSTQCQKRKNPTTLKASKSKAVTPSAASPSRIKTPATSTASSTWFPRVA